MGNRPYRVLWFGLAAALIFPIVFWAKQRLTAPTLYEGDKIEVRACRECGGTGKDPEQARDYPQLGDRCPACAGEGKVDVLIPGPNHPTLIRGAVAAQAALTPFSTYDEFRPIARPQHDNATLISAAKIVFSTSGKHFEAAADNGGHFRVELPPEHYSLECSAAGYVSTKADFDVGALTEPIWQEKAHIIREPRTIAEAQSLYGFGLLVALSRSGEPAGFVRLSEGAP